MEFGRKICCEADVSSISPSSKYTTDTGYIIKYTSCIDVNSNIFSESAFNSPLFLL